MNLENLFIYALLGGVALVLLGHVLMIIMAMRQSTSWGLGVLFLPPLGGLAFLVKHTRRALVPLGIMLAGAILIGTAYVPALIGGPKKAPVVRYERDDVQLTVTGAEQFDYAQLAEYPHLAMLQMANADVTDTTLEHLRRMSKLKNLDLSNTQITDAGLAVIQELPALEELRLARTAITDAGFRKHLMAMPTLMKLDLTGTAVSKETVQEWRKAKPGRRALQ